MLNYTSYETSFTEMLSWWLSILHVLCLTAQMGIPCTFALLFNLLSFSWKFASFLRNIHIVGVEGFFCFVCLHRIIPYIYLYSCRGSQYARHHRIQYKSSDITDPLPSWPRHWRFRNVKLAFLQLVLFCFSLSSFLTFSPFPFLRKWKS